jgi:hypothetical protein
MQAGRVSEVKVGACGLRREAKGRKRENDQANTAKPN